MSIKNSGGFSQAIYGTIQRSWHVFLQIVSHVLFLLALPIALFFFPFFFFALYSFLLFPISFLIQPHAQGLAWPWRHGVAETQRRNGRTARNGTIGGKLLYGVRVHGVDSGEGDKNGRKYQRKQVTGSF
jgi:hypothetical protein